MPVSRTALAPFFRVLKTALGPQAATTKISIGGGLKLQMQNIREAKVSPGNYYGAKKSH